MRGRMPIAIVSCAALLSVPWPASSQNRSPRILRIEQLYLDSEYERALRECATALREPGLIQADREELLKYMGTMYFAQDNVTEARNAFARLLRINPGYRLPPDWPPRIVEQFERIRSDLLPSVRIRHQPPEGFRLGTPLVLSAQVLFVADDHQVRVHYRVQPGGLYSAVDMAREEGDLWTGVVPTTAEMSPDHDTPVQYYISVEDHGRTLASAGTEGRPLEFIVQLVGPNRATRTGGALTTWLLVGAGVVVAALGVGALVYLSSASNEPTGAANVQIVLPE